MTIIKLPEDDIELAKLTIVVIENDKCEGGLPKDWTLRLAKKLLQYHDIIQKTAEKTEVVPEDSAESTQQEEVKVTRVVGPKETIHTKPFFRVMNGIDKFLFTLPPNCGPAKHITDVYLSGHDFSLLYLVNSSKTTITIPKAEFVPNNHLVSGILCKVCNTIIYSRHRHDFVSCSCQSCSIDGGSDYCKVSIVPNTDYEYVNIDFSKDL